jgi:ketosteroid isomerase-like protein
MPASATEQDIRAALLQHWAASDANDFPTEHQIYCDDAILDYLTPFSTICSQGARSRASKH